VTTLVSLDSPVGLHEGGQVAAPVFKRIAEQVLAYLDVPRDVPLNPKLIQTAFMKHASEDESALEDFSVVDFSGQPDPSPAASQTPGVSRPELADSRAVLMDQGGDIEVPDFSGKTMRDVTDIALRLRLEPVLVGSNLATEQLAADLASDNAFGTFDSYGFGKPWDPKSANSSESPLTFVENVHTPVMILHSSEDIRTPVDQSLQEFNALKILGRQAIYVDFPGESHDLSRTGGPLHRVERLRIETQWLDEFLHP